MDLGEECGAGAELEVVRGAKDVASGAIGMQQQNLATFDQARAEDGMCQIGGSLVEALDRVKLGG